MTFTTRNHDSKGVLGGKSAMDICLCAMDTSNCYRPSAHDKNKIAGGWLLAIIQSWDRRVVVSSPFNMASQWMKGYVPCLILQD